MYGYRELYYFLSRFPKAKTLEDWEYDPISDCWKSPGRPPMKVRSEAWESISICMYSGGLSRRQIMDFVEENIKNTATLFPSGKDTDKSATEMRDK